MSAHCLILLLPGYSSPDRYINWARAMAGGFRYSSFRYQASLRLNCLGCSKNRSGARPATITLSHSRPLALCWVAREITPGRGSYPL